MIKDYDANINLLLDIIQQLEIVAKEAERKRHNILISSNIYLANKKQTKNKRRNDEDI